MMNKKYKIQKNIFLLVIMLSLSLFLIACQDEDPYEIGGQIVSENNENIEGVIIQITGDVELTIDEFDSSGEWSAIVKGNVTITPSLQEFVFYPQSKEVSEAGTNVNFVAFEASGKVSNLDFRGSEIIFYDRFSERIIDDERVLDLDGNEIWQIPGNIDAREIKNDMFYLDSTEASGILNANPGELLELEEYAIEMRFKYTNPFVGEFGFYVKYVDFNKRYMVFYNVPAQEWRVFNINYDWNNRKAVEYNMSARQFYNARVIIQNIDEQTVNIKFYIAPEGEDYGEPLIDYTESITETFTDPGTMGFAVRNGANIVVDEIWVIK